MENSSAPIRLAPLESRHGGTSASRRGPRASGKKVAKKARPASLAELRERNGVSLNDIAERTRIPRHHLEELERGDVSNWPAGVYAKSWARDYANEAGIDPDQVSAFVAPVAAVEISTDDISKARTLRDRTSAGRAATWGTASTLLTRIATVIIVLVLVAIAAVYVWKTTEPAPQGSGAPRPVGTSGVSPGQPPR